jgi:HEAT repeat protein
MTRLLAALTILAAAVLTSGRCGADQLSITGTFPGKPASAAERAVFPTDVPEITARVSLPTDQKTKVGFRWLDPDGKPFQHTLATVFPAKSAKAVNGTDVLVVAGTTASERPGWWVVEAELPDKKLSTRFLLTKSRQVVTLAYGEKAGKLGVLKRASPGSPDFRDMTGLAMDDPDGEVRAAGLLKLGGLTDDWAMKLLHAGQKDESPLVRVAALKSLLSAGGEAAAEAASGAASDRSPDVRKAVVEGYPVTADERGVDLYEKLIKDSDPGVRSATLRSLSRQEGMASFQALAEGLKVDDYGLKRAVIDLIASRSGPGRAAALAAGLPDADPEIRLKAIKGLSTESGEGALELIRPMLEDENGKVALLALETLAGRGDLPGLELAVRSRREDIKKKALEALLRIKDASALRGLTAAMKDEDLKIRKAALGGLIASGRAGVPGLVAALSDKDAGIRSEAASALDRLGVKEAEGPMLAALDDPEASVRSRALAYFIQQGGPALPGILEHVACDKDPDIRATGLGRLAGISGEGSSRALRAYLDCGDTGVRQAVVDILATRDDAVSMEVIKASIKDKDPGVRLKSAERLLAIGAAGPLVGLASDPDPRIRKIALSAMEKAPGPEVLPMLRTMVGDADEGVRLLALGLLGRIPGEQSSAAISQAVKDSSPQVSGYAMSLLLSRRDEAAAAGLYDVFMSDRPGAREGVLAALGAIPGRVVDEMLYRIFSTAQSDEKVRVLDMLAGRKPELLTRALSEALSDKDPKVRAAALGHAKDVPEDAASQVYLAALSSVYPEVRQAGIERLGTTGGEAAAAALVKELDDPEPVLRRLALSCLVSLHEPSLDGRLARLVQDGDPDIRQVAFNAALGVKDPSKKADILLAAAGGPYPDLAQAAVEGLLPLDDARALPFYVKSFRAGYRRHELIGAIARMKGEDATEAVSSAYRDASDDEALRLIAVETLAARDAGALPALSEAVLDPSPRVRRAAVKAIAGIDAPGREGMLGRAVTDSDQQVRKYAWAALSRIDGPEAFRRMLPGLNDPGIREEAFTVLAQRRGQDEQAELASYAAALEDAEIKGRVLDTLDGNGAPAGLITKFAGGSDFKVRQKAVKALSKRTGPEAAYGLLLFGADDDARLRDIAGSAVSDMKPEDIQGGIALLFERGRAREAELSFAARTLRDAALIADIIRRVPADEKGLLDAALSPVISRHAPYDVPAIMEGLKAADPEQGRALARALAASQGPDTGKSLAEAYARYPYIRGDLIRSAGEGGRAGDLLPLAIRDEDVGNRREAARYLGVVKDRTLTSRAIGDTDEAVRLEAASAACETGDEAVLTLAAKDSVSGIRKAAARGLGGVGGDNARKLLLALAQESDAGVSDEAVASLQKLGDRVPSADWAELARNTANRRVIRLNAMSALAGRAEPGSAPVFAGALDDRDPELKKVAMDGLKGLSGKSLPALYPLLKDPSRRMTALLLLSEIGDSTSEGPVLAELPRMDNAAKVSAVNALGRFGGQKSVGPLAAVYKDGPADLKNAVVKALGVMKLAPETVDAEPPVIEILSDALKNGSNSIRFNAAHTAAALKAGRLKGDMEKRLGVEQSDLIKEELTRAINAVSGK